MAANTRRSSVAGAVKAGATLMVTALLSVGITGYVPDRPHPRLSMAVVPTAAIVESPTSIGISDSSLFFGSDAEIDKTFEELKKLGVQNIRIQIPWAGVEIAPDALIWQAIDKQVDAAVAHGMGILGVINQSPSWVADEWAGHPDPAEFAEFAGDVARRYKGEISAYEIWNEPNSVQFFDPIDPAAYAELLRAAYPAIKEVDSSITVVGGVLGAVIGQGNVVLNPVKFVEEMLAANAKGAFDALSFHPYQYTLKFSEGDGQIASPKRQIEAIQKLLRDYQIDDMPIWATEYGLPTPDGNVDQQAAFIEDFLRAWQDVQNAGPIFIYTTRDFAEGSPNDQDNFGIFYADWTPKPAAQVIKDFIESLEPGHPIIDAIRAAVRALVQVTGDVIRFGAEVVVDVIEAVVDVTKFVVDTTIDVVKLIAKTTAEVITSVVQFGVDVVKAGVDVIRAVVDRIVTAVTDCFAPDSAGSAVAEVRDPTIRRTATSAATLDSPPSVPVAEQVAVPDPDVTSGPSEQQPEIEPNQTVREGDLPKADLSGGQLEVVETPSHDDVDVADDAAAADGTEHDDQDSLEGASSVDSDPSEQSSQTPDSAESDPDSVETDRDSAETDRDSSDSDQDSAESPAAA